MRLRCDDLVSQKDHSILVVTGTAGSGKSTVLKRLASSFVQEGKAVAWIDSMHRPPIPTIRKALSLDSAPEILVVDDAAIYGKALPELPNAASASDRPTLTVIGLRSNQVERLLGSLVGCQGYAEFVVPDLDDSDISGLLGSLSKFNRLGVLGGLTHEQRVERFREKCGRQLLVAMIEATSGVAFEEKCRREFDDLSTLEQEFYGTVAVATSRQITLTREDCILATDQRSNDGIDSLERMISRGLIARIGGSGLRLRHGVVADKVVDRLIADGRMADHVSGVLVALCLKLDFGLARNTRPWKNVTRLLNHEYLLRVCALDGARKVFEELEGILCSDHHYWLQRACLEIESGDAAQGEIFVNQAYGIAPGDPFVRVERAYAMLKHAHHHPRTIGSKERVANAICRRPRRSAGIWPRHDPGVTGLEKGEALAGAWWPQHRAWWGGAMSVFAGTSWRWGWRWRLLGALVAPGIGIDVDDVATLDEAIHQRADACGTGEDGAPVLEG